MNAETMNSSKLNSMNEGSKIVHSVGMVVTLVSFGMLFLTLMMGFAIYRFTAPVWPPQGMVRPSLFLPTISTIIIFLSSVSYVWFEKNPEENVNGLRSTFVLGILFMVVQTLFWMNLHSEGIYTSSGIFPSIIYAFTWIHAAHIVFAVGFLGWLIATFKTVSIDKRVLRISNVGKFWHFLGIVWLIMFISIFVI